MKHENTYVLSPGELRDAAYEACGYQDPFAYLRDEIGSTPVRTLLQALLDLTEHYDSGIAHRRDIEAAAVLAQIITDKIRDRT